jgi:hypothetical protein
LAQGVRAEKETSGMTCCPKGVPKAASPPHFFQRKLCAGESMPPAELANVSFYSNESFPDHFIAEKRCAPKLSPARRFHRRRSNRTNSKKYNGN